MTGRGYVVMGVSGCGKSTIGRMLADALDLPFLDGDSLHGPDNIAKMSRGEALTDADRWPWLDRVGAALAGGQARVVACSALRRAYRDRIAAAAGMPVTFLFLDGTRAVLDERVNARPGHFMPPALLDSQLATLECPVPPEDVVRVDIDQAPEAIVAALLAGMASV